MPTEPHLVKSMLREGMKFRVIHHDVVLFCNSTNLGNWIEVSHRKENPFDDRIPPVIFRESRPVEICSLERGTSGYMFIRVRPVGGFFRGESMQYAITLDLFLRFFEAA